MIFENLKNFLKLIRWFHELLAILPFVGLYFVIDHYAQKNGLACNLSGINFSILCLGVQSLIAAGCILNDIMDRDIDKINKPKTNLIGRVISLKTAKVLFIATTILILILSVYISYYMFSEWAFISAGVYLCSILYDVYLKKSPLFGNILIAALASFIPFVLFFYARDCITALNNERINLLIWLYCFFPFLIIIPRELSLDISDIEGDKACGSKSLPILIGIRKARLIVASIIIFIIILSIFLVYHYTYLIPAFLLIDLLLVFYLLKLKNSQIRIDYIRAGRFLWFVMIFGLIGFTVSTIYS